MVKLHLAFVDSSSLNVLIRILYVLIRTSRLDLVFLLPLYSAEFVEPDVYATTFRPLLLESQVASMEMYVELGRTLDGLPV